MHPAKHSRIEKEAHPELYCATKDCLWRIQTTRGPNPCRNHPIAVAPVSVEEPDDDHAFGPEQVGYLADDPDCPQPQSSVPRCPVCSAYLTDGQPCDADSMTTAEIARLIWDLEEADAVSSGLDWGRVTETENIAQLNKHLDQRMKALAHA